MKPLIIYLDTQDYYNLYEKKDRDTEDLYNYLTQKVDAGDIKICFSFVIIAEFLTSYTPEHEIDRNNRVKLIQSLCKKHCFKYPLRWDENGIISNNGDWLPKELSFFDIVEKQIQAQIGEYLSQPMNRRQRRKIDQNHPLKHLIKDNPLIYNESLKEKGFAFPLPGELLHTNNFMKYLCGEYPKSKMKEILDSYLKDLKIFNQVWHKHSGYSDYLYSMLKALGKPYVELVGKYRDIMQNILQLEGVILPLKKEIKKGYLGLEVKESYEAFAALNSKISNLKYDDLKEEFSQYLETSQLPEDFLRTILCYVKGNYVSRRNILDSDSGDLLHALFLPHCDIWRGDKSFCHTLVAEKAPGYQNVIGKLSDLRNTIDAKLSSRK